ncbi:MAG: hypothetical protein MZU79_02585 [Anaerotruncus sp.]|nr:hypothetical protein [Anaerotruncus sp.]
METGVTPDSIDFTPEGIHGYLTHLVNLMTVLEGGMDDADIANLKLLAKDAIYIALWFEDMPLETKITLIPNLQDAVDVYFDRLVDVYGTMHAAYVQSHRRSNRPNHGLRDAIRR